MSPARLRMPFETADEIIGAVAQLLPHLRFF
jgi:hypothetical protein